jgi:hypothetical protein
MLADHQDVLSLSEFFNVIGGETAFSRESLDGQELWRLVSVPSVEAVRILEAEAIPEIRFRGDIGWRVSVVEFRLERGPIRLAVDHESVGGVLETIDGTLSKQASNMPSHSAVS